MDLNNENKHVMQLCLAQQVLYVLNFIGIYFRIYECFIEFQLVCYPSHLNRDLWC